MVWEDVEARSPWRTAGSGLVCCSGQKSEHRVLGKVINFINTCTRGPTTSAVRHPKMHTSSTFLNSVSGSFTDGKEEEKGTKKKTSFLLRLYWQFRA